MYQLLRLRRSSTVELRGLLLVPAIPLVHAQVEEPFFLDTLRTSGKSPMNIQREVLFRSDNWQIKAV